MPRPISRLSSVLVTPRLRLLGIAAGVVTGLCAAVACGAPAHPPAARSLVVWHTQDRFQARFLKQILAEFVARHPGVTVETEDIVDLSAVLLKGAALGALPDVVFAPADTVGMHVPLRLSSIGKQERNSAVGAEHYAAVTLDGRAYGEPVLSGNHLVFYYDTSLLPAAPASWEELARWKDEGRVKEPRARRGALGGWPFNDPYFFLPFLLARGGVDLSTARIDVARTADALVAYEALAKGGLAQANCGYLCTTEDFYRGRFAYVVNGEWAFEDTRAALGDRFGMAPLPTFGGRRMISPRGVFALMFPSDGLSSSKGPLLRSLARWMQSEEVQRRYAREATRFPVNVGVSARLDAQGDAQFSALARLLRESAPVTPSPAMLFVWPALRKGINLYLTAGVPPKEATRILEDTARAAAVAFERLAPKEARP